MGRGLKALIREIEKQQLSSPDQVRNYLIEQLASLTPPRPNHEEVTGLANALREIDKPGLLDELKVYLARVRYYGGALGALNYLANKYASKVLQ